MEVLTLWAKNTTKTFVRIVYNPAISQTKVESITPTHFTATYITAVQTLKTNAMH
jgi:hypothetical protein